MLMVVFGAGASYDSVSATPLPAGADLQDFVVDDQNTSRLPLANQLFKPTPLFSAVLNRFPQAAPLFHSLNAAPRSVGVEARLEEYQQESKTRPDRTAQLGGLRFYLREVIEQAEARWIRHQRARLNHIALIDEIEGGRKGDDVLLVTFNYDTLIEASLNVLGMEIHTLADYIGSHPYKVIKLHGSTNWGRSVTFPIEQWEPAQAPLPPATIIKAAGDWQLSNNYVRLDNYADTDSAGNIYVPAIAVPVVQKSTFECPKNHLDALRALLPRVDRILAVGWAGNEKHFLKLLASDLDQPPAIAAVSGSEAQAQSTIDNITAAGFKFGRTHAFAQGYSGFVEERAGKAFFNWT